MPRALESAAYLSPKLKMTKRFTHRHRFPDAPDITASTREKPLHYRAVKRLADVVVSVCVVVAGFIPGLILSVAIMVNTGGTPIYSQIRVGRHGKPFCIYKFRTMVADSNDLEKYLSPEQLDSWKREHKVEADPRITKLGSALRTTSIDEFPQFINVLLGQISIVGPRPITYDELECFGRDKDLLLSVSPGITGLWQTGPRNDATFESGQRQAIELAYVENANIFLDARIFFKTFAVFFERTGK